MSLAVTWLISIVPQALFAWLLKAVFSKIFLFKSRHFFKDGKTLNPGTTTGILYRY